MDSVTTKQLFNKKLSCRWQTARRICTMQCRGWPNQRYEDPP